MSWKQVQKYTCNDQDHDRITRFTRNKVMPRRSTAHLAATSVMLSSIPQHLLNAVFDEDTKKMMEMRELINHPNPIIREIWIIELANEWGKLLLVIGKGKNRKRNSRVGDGHNTIKFIHKHQVPGNKKVSYPRLCCYIRSQKEETHRAIITVGGDRLDYSGNTATEVASLETTKIHANSTISTPGARQAFADIGNFYTNSRLR